MVSHAPNLNKIRRVQQLFSIFEPVNLQNFIRSLPVYISAGCPCCLALPGISPQAKEYLLGVARRFQPDFEL